MYLLSRGTERAVHVDGDPSVARQAPVVQASHGFRAREDVYVFPFDPDPTIGGDKAAIVGLLSVLREGKADEVGNENGSAQRENLAVHGKREERNNGGSPRSSTPRKLLWIEGFKADLLIGARARSGTLAVPPSEADSLPGGELAAALHTQGIVKLLRHLGNCLAALVVHLNRWPAMVPGRREVVVGVAKDSERSPA